MSFIPSLNGKYWFTKLVTILSPHVHMFFLLRFPVMCVSTTARFFLYFKSELAQALLFATTLITELISFALALSLRNPEKMERCRIKSKTESNKCSVAF